MTSKRWRYRTGVAAGATPCVFFALLDGCKAAGISGKRIHFSLQKPLTTDLVARSLKAAYSLQQSTARIVRIVARFFVTPGEVSSPLIQSIKICAAQAQEFISYPALNREISNAENY